jgi:hypothetical protein
MSVFAHMTATLTARLDTRNLRFVLELRNERLGPLLEGDEDVGELENVTSGIAVGASNSREEYQRDQQEREVRHEATIQLLASAVRTPRAAHVVLSKPVAVVWAMAFTIPVATRLRVVWSCARLAKLRPRR